MALITLTTDFGTADPFVGIMKGVIAGGAPTATVIDLTHGVPPQAVLVGALVLRHSIPYFPAGTIHVAVVDPGVGTARRPLCVETARALLVGPDNGVLSLAAPPADVRCIVHLTNEAFFLSPRSHTFHGRDVFAPAAAALAAGTLPTALGVEVSAMARLELPPVISESDALRGQVIYIDHFGNLCTNIPETALTAFPGRELSITLGTACLRGPAASYAAVAAGEPVVVVNSWGMVEIAVREGSAQARLEVAVGAPVVVRVR